MGLVGLVPLLVSPALAQDGNPRTEAPMHIGPLYVTPVLNLTRMGVDTNMFNSSGQPQSDFTFTGGPKIDFAVPLRQFENQRGINFDMALRGEVQLPRLTFFLQDSYLNTRARANSEIDVRARRRENEAERDSALTFSEDSSSRPPPVILYSNTTAMTQSVPLSPGLTGMRSRPRDRFATQSRP